LHEPSLTGTRSTQYKQSGSELHYEPGAQVDVIDWTVWRLEVKATFGYQLDLYQLHKIGDNSQLLGQGSVALKLFEEPGDGKTRGLGLDLGVQVQKGFWPNKDPGTYPWTAAGVLILHTNW